MGCTVGSNGCSATAGRNAWFTNYTSVPEMTIDKELLSGGRRFKSSAGLHPWTSPGAALTYGNGCGLNGGNPDGCDGEGASKFHLDYFGFRNLNFRQCVWAMLWQWPAWRGQSGREMRGICGREASP